MTGLASRRKGYAANLAVVHYLNDHGFPHARVRPTGAAGSDIDELPPGLEIEVKNRERWDLSGWLDKLADDMEAHESPMGAVIIKRKGTTDVSRWWFVQTFDLMGALLEDSGQSGFAVECRNLSSLETSMAMAAAEVTQAPPGRVPYVEIPRRGRGVMESYSLTTVGHGVRLLRAAGWGTPLEET